MKKLSFIWSKKVTKVIFFQEQLDRAVEAKDDVLEAEAYGNLGIAKIHLGRHDEAIGNFNHLDMLKSG